MTFTPCTICKEKGFFNFSIIDLHLVKDAGKGTRHLFCFRYMKNEKQKAFIFHWLFAWNYNFVKNIEEGK